ncbi:MAG TPA: hypothetical protein VF712_11260 [Thermoleophilaceae bacterium]
MRSRLSRRPAALAALAACAGLAGCGGSEPAEAAGAAREFEIAAPLAGPALAGEEVVVAYPGGSGRFAVRALRHGGRRTLSQFGALVNQGRPGDRALTIDASASGVAVGLSLIGGGDEPRAELGQLQVAPLSGAATTLARCRGGAFEPGEVAVTGSVVGYMDAVCRRGIFTRSGFGRRASARRIAFVPRRLRVAGAYVAAGRAGAVRVYDRGSGRERYRAPFESLDASFDVARDGSLAVVAGTQTGCAVRVHSPSQPGGTRLPQTAACGPVRIAGGRLLFARAVANDREQLVITDLAGGDERAVSPPLVAGTLAAYAPRSANLPEDGIDFDGRRFAYFAPGCVHSRLVVGPVPAPGAPEAQAGDCPLTLELGEELRADAKGALFLPLTCPRGCLAGATLRRDDAGGTAIDLRDSTIELPPGPARTRGRLTLHPESLSRLRREGATRVRIELRYVQRDGSERTASAQTTLVPPS